MWRVSRVTGDLGGVGLAEVAASSRGVGLVAPTPLSLLVGDVTTCCLELGTQSYT